MKIFGGAAAHPAPNPLGDKDLRGPHFLALPLDTPCECVYNGGMLKAAIIGVLALIFLPAIKLGLLCAVQALNYIPTLFS